ETHRAKRRSEPTPCNNPASCSSDKFSAGQKGRRPSHHSVVIGAVRDTPCMREGIRCPVPTNITRTLSHPGKAETRTCQVSPSAVRRHAEVATACEDPGSGQWNRKRFCARECAAAGVGSLLPTAPQVQEKP